MEMYLLKSAACLAFLMLFYKLLLEKESIHVFKRYYLLAAVIISGIIPLITFQTYIEAAPILPMGENWLEASEVSSENQTSWISNFLWSIYLSGVLLFGGKFIRNFFKIVHRIRKNQKVETEEVSTVLLPEDLPPHTFWSYIFLNKQKFQKGQIPKEVLEHEKAHAVQKHTADVLFVELLQVFLWFNPLIWLLKRSVKLNHEFLADRAVLRNGIRPATYQRTLLAFSSNAFDSNLVNSINYQSIKKRFTVMKKQPSQKAVLVKYFLFLPLLAGLLYSFSSTETVIVQETTTVTESLQKKATPEMIKEYNELVNRGNEEKILKAKDANRILYIESLLSSEQKENVEERDLKIFQAPLEQEKASPEMVAEYNKWAKRYNNNDETLVERKVWDRMNYIYRIMTPTQKNKSEKFPSLNSVEIITITEDADGRFEKRNGEIPLPPAPPVPPVTKDGNVPPPPPPPPAPPVDKVGDMPAPPPPPPSPIEAVKDWIEEGAEFFYNGKKVSGKEALEIVQKNNGKNLSVKVEEKTYSSVGNIKVSTGKTVRLTDKKN